MLLPLNLQFNIIIFAILAGILTGFLFDFYRIIRGYGIPKLIIIIEDILFWIFCSLVVFAFLLIFNYAFLGTYVYIIMGIVVLIHLKFISPKFIKMEKKFIYLTYKSGRITVKNLIYVLKSIFSK
ncbi:spore cortex biosynthesis protein YabQ [Clostridium tarantellae]|uniref:Spore cortex biosynthesis protein YabQ n=1 Tax=Clostridium tarantellae TaxID=39493 RepID=A0A6I1MFP0_9CLOT|nr:spore cortex biosynthesis protein YabQ [Clostridium tarantellae]MPQ42165.1 spore cortex biosynthesis protein YabQ [Clostridium tarantellae]